MLSPTTSSPSLPSRALYEPTVRRSDGAPFYMHSDEEDSFYSSRKSSDDMEAGCLVPSDTDDVALADPNSKTGRRGIYAAYRHWFRAGSPHNATVQLGEKDAEPRLNRAAIFERRLQTGSWCAMFVLALLTIYFLIHEA